MATTPYLDVASYKALSLLQSALIDRVEAASPGFVLGHLVERSSFLNARLSKRYDAPFASPYPEAVTGWLVKLVDPLVLFKSGFRPADETALKITQRETEAREEIKEAANSDEGLFELPLRANTNQEGVTKGGPFGYSEQSPYVWTDGQGEAGHQEDTNGRGSGT